MLPHSQLTKPPGHLTCHPALFRRYVLINFNLENDLSVVATVTWQREKQKKLIFQKNCYLVLAGGPPRVVGPGAPHHLHHLYGRHWPPCLFFQALAFLIPYIHLDAEDISSPCPNETLLFIRMCSLIDVCFSILTSIIPPRCILFFYFSLCFFSSLYCVFSCSLFVLKVRMSPLFVKGLLS